MVEMGPDDDCCSLCNCFSITHNPLGEDGEALQGGFLRASERRVNVFVAWLNLFGSRLVAAADPDHAPRWKGAAVQLRTSAAPTGPSAPVEYRSSNQSAALNLLPVLTSCVLASVLDG